MIRGVSGNGISLVFFLALCDEGDKHLDGYQAKPASNFSFSASVTGCSDDVRRQIMASLYSEKSKSWYLLMDFPPYL